MTLADLVTDEKAISGLGGAALAGALVRELIVFAMRTLTKQKDDAANGSERVDRVEERQNNLEERMNNDDQRFSELVGRINRIEARVDRKLDEIIGLLQSRQSKGDAA